MIDEKNCKIVQDLLPNYIEKLNNKETDLFVENHLNECVECKKIFENMQNEFKVKINKRDNREVKYIKKYNKKMKAMKIIVMIILFLLLLGGICSTVHIFKNRKIYFGLYESAYKMAESDNYHIEEYTYNGVDYVKQDMYVMGKKSYNKLQRYDSENNRIMVLIQYFDGEKTQIFIESIDDEKVEKSYQISEQPVMMGNSLDACKIEKKDLVFGIKDAFFTRIKEGKINGIDCYKIDYGEKLADLNKFELESVYKDKKTGLTIRSCSGKLVINGNESIMGTNDYTYEFGNVSEDDFILPDISDYTVVENNSENQ